MVDEEITLDKLLEIWRANANTYAPFPIMSAQLLRACEEIEKLEKEMTNIWKVTERKMIEPVFPKKVAKIVLSDGVVLEGPFALEYINETTYVSDMGSTTHILFTLNGLTREQYHQFWTEIP